MENEALEPVENELTEGQPEVKTDKKKVDKKALDAEKATRQKQVETHETIRK